MTCGDNSFRGVWRGLDSASELQYIGSRVRPSARCHRGHRDPRLFHACAVAWNILCQGKSHIYGISTQQPVQLYNFLRVQYIEYLPESDIPISPGSMRQDKGLLHAILVTQVGVSPPSIVTIGPGQVTNIFRAESSKLSVDKRSGGFCSWGAATIWQRYA